MSTKAANAIAETPETLPDEAGMAYLQSLQADQGAKDRARVAMLSGAAHCIGGDNRLAMIVRRLLLPCGVLQDLETERVDSFLEAGAPTDACMHDRKHGAFTR